MSERERLIIEGEKFFVGYQPGAKAYSWVLKAILFLLKSKGSRA